MFDSVCVIVCMCVFNELVCFVCGLLCDVVWSVVVRFVALCFFFFCVACFANVCEGVVCDILRYRLFVVSVCAFIVLVRFVCWFIV